MKQWLITANAPFCGTETHYRAYSESNPLEKLPELEDDIVQELWYDYSYLLHLDDEDYDSEEDRDAAYDQAQEDWKYDCNIYAEEATDEDFKMYAPGGDVKCLEIIYDERNEE